MRVLLEVINAVHQHKNNVVDSTRALFQHVFGLKPEVCEVQGNAMVCKRRVTRSEAERCCREYAEFIARLRRVVGLRLVELVLAVEVPLCSVDVNVDGEARVGGVRVFVAEEVGVVVATASIVAGGESVGTLWIIAK